VYVSRAYLLLPILSLCFLCLTIPTYGILDSTCPSKSPVLTCAYCWTSHVTLHRLALMFVFDKAENYCSVRITISCYALYKIIISFCCLLTVGLHSILYWSTCFAFIKLPLSTSCNILPKPWQQPWSVTSVQLTEAFEIVNSSSSAHVVVIVYEFKWKPCFDMLVDTVIFRYLSWRFVDLYIVLYIMSSYDSFGCCWW
jgi:hypothetical protein